MSELFDFVTEQLLPEDNAKELLQPYRHELVQVWVKAWNHWKGLSEDTRARLGQTPFLPAINLFGFAQSYAKEIFSGRDSEEIVVCDRLHNVFGFYLKNKLLLRFNTLGADHIVHGTQNTTSTEHKELYFRQEPIYGLVNSATRLTIGSVANAAKTDLGCVVASCQVGDALHYSFQIDEADGISLAGPAATIPPQPPNFSQNLRTTKPR